MTDLAMVRAWYAEEVRYAAGVRSPAVVAAFAAVPRERFLGPGPWQVCTGAGPDKYWPTDSADPACVYHNVVIGMLPEKGLNNGHPSFWAYLLDRLDLGGGKHVLHLGCGAGYYTALLAEMVGPSGRVTGIDVEDGLVARAREALAPWRQAEVVNADGATYAPPAPVDLIVASAGATHPIPQWLDVLAPGGQLLLPLTGEHGWGQVLLATRQADSDAFAARFVGHVGIYHFLGARDGAAARRLDVAFARRDAGKVESLRRDGHAEDETCWLHGDAVCLSLRRPST
jgi:protein-L-isoaspartate(D-aspartate) O-methyltransferase